MVKKVLLTAAASAVGAQASCDILEYRIPKVEQAFAQIMKDTCNTDVTIDACLAGRSDGSTGLRFDYVLRDSRGLEFVAEAVHADRKDVPVLRIPEVDACEGNTACIQEFLCNVKPTLMARDLKLPVRESGIIHTEEEKAMYAANLAERAMFKATPETMMADRLELANLWLMGNDASYKVLPAHLQKEELTEEETLELASLKDADYEKYMELASDVSVEFTRDSEGVVQRHSVNEREMILTGAEDSADASDESRPFNAARALKDMRYGNLSIQQLAKFFNTLQDNYNPADFDNRNVLAAVNSLLPKNFNPREDKRDASLPDTRACFSLENVRNQAQCGSCWAYSVVTETSVSSCVRSGALLRSAKTGVVAPLSAQAVMDCQTSLPGRDPCTGGSMSSNIPVHALDAEYTYTRRCNSNVKDSNGNLFDGAYLMEHLAKNGKDLKKECDRIRSSIPSDNWPCACTPVQAKGAQETCNQSRFNGRVNTEKTINHKMSSEAFYIGYLKGLVYFNGATRYATRAHDQFIEFFTKAENRKKVFRTDMQKYPPSSWVGEHNHHAVTLVGWGFDDSAKKEYFLFQNSWGLNHGDKGLDRIYVDDPVLKENFEWMSTVYTSKVAVKNSSTAVPDLQKMPTRVSVNKSLVQIHGGLAGTVMFPVNCDTAACEVFYGQDSVVAGVHMHDSWIAPNLRVQPIARYLALDAKLLAKAPRRDFVRVSVVEHNSHVTELEVKVPFALVENWTALNASVGELRSAGLQPAGDSQTVNFGKFCTNPKAAKLANFQRMCKIWTDSRL